MSSTTNSRSDTIAGSVTKYWLALFTIIVFIFFCLCSSDFCSITNILSIFSLSCVMAIVGIGETIIMACGEVDIACGTELATSAVVLAVLLNTSWCSNYYLALILTLIVMVLFGALNAFLNIKIGIPSFIATMGTQLFVQGIILYLSNNGTMFSVAWPSVYKFIGQTYLLGFIPMPMIALIIIGGIMWVYTERTKDGRSLYAVGSNFNACKYVGINAKKQKLKAYIICAVLCGIGGIIQSSMLNSASPTMGNTAIISAFTMLMLGATFLKIGVFNVPGTIVGALLVEIIDNGMTKIGASMTLKDFVQGGILVIAVTAVTIIRSRKKHIVLKT